MAGGKDRTWYFVTCECGKRSYMNRANAKKAARRIDRSLHAYKCKLSGLWHIGHLPDVVRRGHLSREEIYPTENEEEA